MDPTLRIALRTLRQIGRYFLQTYDRPPYGRMKKTALEQFTRTSRQQLLELFDSSIRKAFPEHKVVDDSDQITRGTESFWYIEVLDGQTNFLRSLDDFCAVVGFFQQHELQHTVVYNYLTDAEYYATKDEIALVNQTRMRVSKTSRLDSAVVGISDGALLLAEESNNTSILSREVASIRISGSIGLDFARVAHGKLDACVAPLTSTTLPLVAGLLVQEAGGVITFEKSHGVVVASNSLINPIAQ